MVIQDVVTRSHTYELIKVSMGKLIDTVVCESLKIFKGSCLFMASVNYSGESPLTHEQRLPIFKLDKPDSESWIPLAGTQVLFWRIHSSSCFIHYLKHGGKNVEFNTFRISKLLEIADNATQRTSHKT